MVIEVTMFGSISIKPRWLGKSMEVHCVYIPQESDVNYMWRRIQVSNVQAERQKKSLLQMCILFHRRAADIQRDRGFKPKQTQTIVDFLMNHDFGEPTKGLECWVTL